GADHCLTVTTYRARQTKALRTRLHAEGNLLPIKASVDRSRSAAGKRSGLLPRRSNGVCQGSRYRTIVLEQKSAQKQWTRPSTRRSTICLRDACCTPEQRIQRGRHRNLPVASQSSGSSRILTARAPSRSNP